MKTMKKLRIGVIGLGMGSSHVIGYRQHPQAEVVALADVDSERLAQRGEEFGITALYTDPMKMLKDEKLDVVSVATPNKFHKPLTLAAFKAGCHVLCEKPMAMNAREGQAMVDAAKEAGKRLMIDFSYRFNDQSYALKKAVESGILGDIYYARTVWNRRRGLPGFGGWFGQKALAGGGPLIDLGVHRLDLALWLMNYPKPTWVMGNTYDPIASRLAKQEKKKFDVEDFASAMIKFENGASLSLEASWAANIKDREEMETRLLGTAAGLVQRNVDEGYQYEAEIYVEREGCQYDMKLHPPVPAAKGAMVHFIDAILTDTPHIATGDEGLTVMKILDAVYASAKKGSPVKIRS
jgi:predicted dehydrogenase